MIAWVGVCDVSRKRAEVKGANSSLGKCALRSGG
jgi:hypothetical protein